MIATCFEGSCLLSHSAHAVLVCTGTVLDFTAREEMIRSKTKEWDTKQDNEDMKESMREKDKERGIESEKDRRKIQKHKEVREAEHFFSILISYKW